MTIKKSSISFYLDETKKEAYPIFLLRIAHHMNAKNT